MEVNPARPRSKKELEITLSKLRPLRNPKPRLEQHTTPPDLAAQLIHWASMMGDVGGKRVADLGTGNGMLAIGSVLYGAREAVGVDIDPEAIEVAELNAKLMGVSDRTRFHVKDVEEFEGNFDTVLMNPPFGTVRRHADLKFLDKALEVGKVVYSIHMAGNSDFLAAKAGEKGARLTHVEKWPFPLRRTFDYHRRKVVTILVEILRFEVVRV